MTDRREEFKDLFSLYLPVTAAVAAIVFSLVLFAVVRYRRRPGRGASSRREARIVELTYAAILACVAAVLVSATFIKESHVDAVSSHPGLRVEVIAFQWQWRFTYPDLGVSVVGTRDNPPTLVVPTRKIIQFSATSKDVIHSFWIPSERFKRDAFPKRTTRFDLVFDKLGESTGRCAEFCGLRHSDMTFQVRVVTQDRFRAWIGEERRTEGA